MKNYWLERIGRERPLNNEEKSTLIDAGWRFANEEYIYIPNDYDGCMAYGIKNIRRVLESVQRRAIEESSP